MRFDRYDKEPRLVLAACFILGMLITWPAMYLESFGEKWGIDPPKSFGALLLLSFVVVALLEEVFKSICLLAFPYQTKHFNEPLDGIVYALMISMGFATVENIIYADRFGLDTVILRAFTAVPAHAVFAIFSGYYIGLAKKDKSNRWLLIIKGIGIAVLLHGIYDFFILQDYYEWMLVLSTLTLFVSIFFAIMLIKKHLNLSKLDWEAQQTSASSVDGVDKNRIASEEE